MRSRATDKRKAPRAESSRMRAGRKVPALTAFFLKSVLGIALVILLAFAVGVFAWKNIDEAGRLRWLEGVSSMIVRDLEDRVTSLQGRLRKWGADPQMRDALLAQGTEGLRTMEDRLTRRTPNALRVRLLRPGVCEGKDSRTGSLSYAGLDLICQAERERRVTLLEMHRLGTPEEHLAIAAPVLDELGETLLGVLHLSLATALLPSTQDAGGESGRILLQQSAAGQAVTIGPGRDGATFLGSPDRVAPVEGTRFRTAAWVGSASWLDPQLLLRGAAAYLMLMILLVLAIWLPLLGLRRALALDYGALVALVEDAVRKKPLRSPQYRLAQTGPVIQVLTDLLRGPSPTAKRDAQVPEDEPIVAAKQADAAGGRKEAKRAAQADGAADEAASAAMAQSEPTLGPESVPAAIFRAYDIRGIVDRDLTADLMRAIGLAVGTEVSEAGDKTVILGRDTRLSGPVLSESLAAGLRKSGCDVLDLGVVPTPLVYFATRFQGETSGVMVTASHNPKSYNGLKVVVGGAPLAGERIKALRERILAGNFSRGDGHYQIGDVITDYVSHVQKDVAIARTLKIVVDCGNAAAAVVAPRLYRALGCELIELDCDPDMGFPGGRVPDPARPECLESLRQAVISHGADLGLAFDGDGDRLGVVDSSGKIIWPDRVLMLLAADVLSRHPGTDVVFDVKSSHLLATEILRHGGRPVMWKSGHAHLKAKLQETGALLAGERSGHIIFRERWFGFDDALYSGARLLEVLALDPRSSAEIFAELPEATGTPELLLNLDEGKSTQIMDAVLEQATQLTGFDLNIDDGLRAESDQGWGLVRSSNTQPALVFRFEANDEAGLAKIQDLFRRIMASAAPDLTLPF